MTTLDAGPRRKPEPSTDEVAAKRVKQLIHRVAHSSAHYGPVATKPPASNHRVITRPRPNSGAQRTKENRRRDFNDRQLDTIALSTGPRLHPMYWCRD